MWGGAADREGGRESEGGGGVTAPRSSRGTLTARTSGWNQALLSTALWGAQPARPFRTHLGVPRAEAAISQALSLGRGEEESPALRPASPTMGKGPQP